MSNIVITGSTRGIGLGLAKEFLNLGHQLVINGRKKEKVDEVVKLLTASGGEVCGYAGNAGEAETHQNLLDLSVKSFGSVDIYINNAGIPNPHLPFIEIEKEDVRNLISTNIYGLVIGTSIVADHMLKHGPGKIFNMEGFGSDGRMREKLTLYGTSKRAVNYFSKSLARELKGSHVQIGVINPGMVRTDLIDQSMKFGSPAEKKQFDKVYRILAEDVETVTPFLVEGILKSNKSYNSVNYLSGTRLAFKIIRLMFSK